MSFATMLPACFGRSLSPGRASELLAHQSLLRAMLRLRHTLCTKCSVPSPQLTHCSSLIKTRSVQLTHCILSHLISTMSVAEAQLSALLALPHPPAQLPPQHPTPGDPWSSASSLSAIGATDGHESSRVLQPQPSFEELQHTAVQLQQLLMAGHRLEALRQAYSTVLVSWMAGALQN